VQGGAALRTLHALRAAGERGRTGTVEMRRFLSLRSLVWASIAGLLPAFAPCAAEEKPVSAAPKGIEVDAAFPSGNILPGKIEGDTVTLKQDRRDTEGWWFYWHFRVRGAAGKTLTFKFADGEPIGVRGPAVSLDEGETWTWLGTKQATKSSFSYAFAVEASSVRFAFAMPYTEANLKKFLARVGALGKEAEGAGRGRDARATAGGTPAVQNSGTPAVRADTLCHSRKGRAVERLFLGKLDGAPRYRVLLTCRHHCCEMMASYAVEGLIEAVLAKDDDGEWFRQNVELLVVPFADKDGVEDGDQGKNRRPHDHNRDYGEASIYPETRALRESVPAWSAGKLRAALDLHCPWIRGDANEYIYIVGSERPETWAQQQRFGQILEKAQTGPLVYRAADNLPFGQKWNTTANFKGGFSASSWSTTLPGVKLATSFELPYANANGKEVNAESARAFGRDLAKALRRYLEE